MLQRPIVYFMIGIPGSGKSTLAQTLDGIVVSSDEIRKEFFGSEDPDKCTDLLKDGLNNIRKQKPCQSTVLSLKS